ncbi:CHAD domain-containing protein [Candidatus Bathyarchaeota archaeon]|nr:CHAD domain-containing protein [Candidatus Bathyarchaeota archaeon]
MEIEAKFSVPDRPTFQRLLEARSLGGLALGEGSVVQIQDRYLDTAEGALRAQGYACRLRQEDGHTLGSLKGLGEAAGVVHRRQELEVELPRPLQPAEWPPGTARDLALHLSGARPLLPLLVISQTRHSRPILAPDSALATLALDDVRVFHSEGLLASFLEVEAELLPGRAEEELERLAAAIQADWALEPQRRSKFERAMLLLQALPPGEIGSQRNLTTEERAIVDRLAKRAEVVARRARALQAWDDGLSRPKIAAHARLSPRRVRHWLSAFRQVRLGVFPPRALQEAMEPGSRRYRAGAPGKALPGLKERPGLLRGDTMGQAAVKVLAFHYRRMLSHEPGTRLGEDVEALHDMRVATRRMRAALRVFQASLDPEVHAALRRGMRRTGRALGPVRDLDVFRQRTRAYQDSLPDEQQGGLDEFLQVLEARREAARERMIAYLNGRRYARFKADMDRFLASAGSPGGPASSDRVLDVAPAAVRERLADVLAFNQEVSLPDPPPERLHALRIACKRLRYTFEFFEEVLGRQTRALIVEIVALQDHLGIIQDAVVAGHILRDYLIAGTWGVEPLVPLPASQVPLAPGVEAYLASNTAEFRHMVATLAPAWHRIAGPTFRRRVASALAAL